jgi:hypothetical protein
MKQVGVSVFLLLLSSLCFGQNVLKAIGCSQFKIIRNPIWATESLSKTFYRHCSDSTCQYVVINSDSTYIIKAEGWIHGVSAGKWNIKNDSLLMLSYDEAFSKTVIKSISATEKVEYQHSYSLDSEHYYYVRGQLRW